MQDLQIVAILGREMRAYAGSLEAVRRVIGPSVAIMGFRLGGRFTAVFCQYEHQAAESDLERAARVEGAMKQMENKAKA